MSFGARRTHSWKSIHWVMYRLKNRDLSQYDVYISDFKTMEVLKISGKAFYEFNKNPKETEQDILNYFGFKTDIFIINRDV